jgi:hypothetical protein
VCARFAELPQTRHTSEQFSFATPLKNPTRLTRFPTISAAKHLLYASFIAIRVPAWAEESYGFVSAAPQVTTHNLLILELGPDTETPNAQAAFHAGSVVRSPLTFSFMRTPDQPGDGKFASPFKTR